MSKVESVRSEQQVALSGSGGLIGSSLSRQLIATGRCVRPLIRQSLANSDEKADSAKGIRWDPEHGLHDPSELNGIGCFVHLAGHSIAGFRWTAAEKKRIRDSRVAATRRMVEQICQLESPPASVISASAVGIYGDCGQQIVDEQCPAANEFLADVASDWEDACQPLRSMGIRVAHPRFGIVLSSQGGALGKALPIFRWYLGGRLGSGQQYWSWISLQDCVRALVWLIETETACGAYNVVSPEPVTNGEFTRTLARALHVPAMLPAPAWALRMVAGEMADALLLCSCRAVPSRLVGEGFTFEQPQLPAYLRSELSP